MPVRAAHIARLMTTATIWNETFEETLAVGVRCFLVDVVVGQIRSFGRFLDSRG
jgi:hypothetical protein